MTSCATITLVGARIRHGGYCKGKVGKEAKAVEEVTFRTLFGARTRVGFAAGWITFAMINVLPVPVAPSNV